jgi:ribonuclease PH
MTAKGSIVEIQATAEKEAFPKAQFEELFDLAKAGIDELLLMQRQVLNIE